MDRGADGEPACRCAHLKIAVRACTKTHTCHLTIPHDHMRGRTVGTGGGSC